MEKIGGIIKSKPEDFIVEEVGLDGKVCRVRTSMFERILDLFPKKFDEQLHFTIVKRNYTTQRAIKKVAEKLRIGMERLGYAGTKDKNALTAQRVSVWNQKISSLKKIRTRDIEIKNFSYSKKRLCLGDLIENRFIITVRDIKLPVDEVREQLEKFKEESAKGIPNYFGMQRFGVQRPVNFFVGVSILKGEFEQAVRTLIAFPGNEGIDARKAREFAATNWGKWNEILKIWPRHLGIEAAVLNYLVKYPTDFANAFRKINKKTRKMFIHSVQSKIFNELIEKMISEKEQVPEFLPLIGFRTETKEYPAAAAEKMLESYGVKKEHFSLRRMPELSEPGLERKTRIPVKDFKVIYAKEGELKVSFTLEKGSYATIVLDVLLGKYSEPKTDE